MNIILQQQAINAARWQAIIDHNGDPPKPELPELLLDQGERAFIRTLYPYCMAAQITRGYPAPVMAAMAFNETGGQSRYIHGHNLFGIKAGSTWDGPVNELRTWEDWNQNGMYDPGEEIISAFRAYASPKESVEDFADFLERNSRYSGRNANTGQYDVTWDVVGQRWNPDGLSLWEWSFRVLRRLGHAGYATDRDYADQVMRIIERNGLA